MSQPTLTPREKKMEIIRQLLAKAYDPSVTEHEACAFRNKARQLMDKYLIDEIGLRTPEEALPVIEEFLTLDSDIRVDRNLLDSMPAITRVVANFFGAEAIWTTRRGAPESMIIGFQPSINMIQYAVNAVVKQGVLQYKKEFSVVRSISMGPSFWIGFSRGLYEKFQIQESEEEVGVVLYDRVKAVAKRNLRDYVRQVDGSMDAYSSGHSAGKNVTLNKPVQAGNGGKLLG